MKYIGAHLSASTLKEIVTIAKEIGATSFSLCTKEVTHWYGNEITEKEAKEFKEKCQELDYKHIMVHAGFLPNLGHPEEAPLKKSRKSFLAEAERCEQIGVRQLVFHPGSHLNKIEKKECLSRIAESMNETITKTLAVQLLIENTAGQGTNVGHTFSEIATIISLIEDKNRVGVCLDTCHAFAAGYDLRTEEGYYRTLEKFDKTIGFKYLKGVHLNDSKREKASKVDRHASLGKGLIGLDLFKMMMKDPRFDDIPLILETPESIFWKDEIQMLKKFMNSKK